MRMRMGSNKKRAEARPKLLVPTGMLVALVGAGIVPADALAACVGTTTVSCTGATTTYSNGANNLNLTVGSGATVSVVPLIGGTALSLTGSGVTLTNNGR
ncbi:hypothetical protein M3633_23990, partial [Cytobacillus kochii]|nr:hypothetical protein [Cytobacillus kochii]